MSWVEQPPHVPPSTYAHDIRSVASLKIHYYRSRIMKPAVQQVDSSKCEVSNKQKGNVLAV